nr:hypothetical protein [Kyrpidia spormannii]
MMQQTLIQLPDVEQNNILDGGFVQPVERNDVVDTIKKLRRQSGLELLLDEFPSCLYTQRSCNPEKVAEF